jgi:diguanylate cyclase (GGDEF)-like protein/PAS domain S-box-containing protein
MPELADPQLFRSILENLNMAVYIVARDGKILFWNDGAERVTGYLRQDVLGRVYEENFLGELDGVEAEEGGARCPVFTASTYGKHVQTRASLRHKSGHRVPVQIWAFPIRNEQGAIVGAAQTFQEDVSVADWDRRQTKLASYGCIDEASGVLNHGMMRSHLREHVAMFAEHPVPFSLLCMEIDNLEKIQARDGPAAIGSVMRIVGQTLENNLRPTDFLGRWQGHQFLAILAECNGSEVSYAADRLRRMVAASKIAWWGDRLPVTLSVGATIVSAGDSEENMVMRAEQALKRSLSEGGNRISVINR